MFTHQNSHPRLLPEPSITNPTDHRARIAFLIRNLMLQRSLVADLAIRVLCSVAGGYFRMVYYSLKLTILFSLLLLPFCCPQTEEPLITCNIISRFISQKDHNQSGHPFDAYAS